MRSLETTALYHPKVVGEFLALPKREFGRILVQDLRPAVGHLVHYVVAEVPSGERSRGPRQLTAVPPFRDLVSNWELHT